MAQCSRGRSVLQYATVLETDALDAGQFARAQVKQAAGFDQKMSKIDRL
jgi:hypothetical protein